MRRAGLAAFAACLALAALVALGIPAAADEARQNQRFLIAGTVESPTALVVAEGLVHGLGTLTAESADFHQDTDSYDETDLLAVGSGSLQVVVHGSFNTWPFTLDPASCSQHGTLKGTWTIASGAGSLAGATGGGTLSGVFLTYAGRTAAGCDETAIKGFVFGPMVGALQLPQGSGD
ncbi:MAG: hypothetical protein QOD49_2682 [Actinomycetota bacterium]|jgi:hypothetical protein|nr:hypothetical protein [Actinomycetota bacterium]